MFTCRACGHADIVHRVFAGCCGHVGCPCTRMDGMQGEQCEEHGEACWWAKPRKEAARPESITVELVPVGNGYRYKVFADGACVKVVRTATKAANWVKLAYGVDIPTPPPKPIADPQVQ